MVCAASLDFVLVLESNRPTFVDFTTLVLPLNDYYTCCRCLYILIRWKTNSNETLGKCERDSIWICV